MRRRIIDIGIDGDAATIIVSTREVGKMVYDITPAPEAGLR